MTFPKFRMPKLKFLTVALATVFVFNSVIVTPAKAQWTVPITDLATSTMAGTAVAEAAKDWSWKALMTAMQKTGSTIFGNILRSTLNKMAMDTATYLGSGAKGQKPLFMTQSWGEWRDDMIDKAAGDFIEGFANDVTSELGLGKFNVCTPNLDVALSIGLGLHQYEAGGYKPNCTLKEMQKGWSSEYDRLNSMKGKDFLKKVASGFNPTSNDIGIALSLNDNLTITAQKKADAEEKARQTNKGWLDVTTLANKITRPAEEVGKDASMMKQMLTSEMARTTGDILVDAVNIFTNQLAITAFKTAMENLTKDDPDDASSISNPNAQSSAIGINAVQNRVRETLNVAKFAENVDIDVLAKLTNCPPDNLGVNDCVINHSFLSAITEELTLAEAFDKGYITKNFIFGYKGDGSEISVNDGLSYRSLVILRKYRVIPVGWEVAAEKMKQSIDRRCYDPATNQSCLCPSVASTTCIQEPVFTALKGEKPQDLTLYDLMGCFDVNDEHLSHIDLFDGKTRDAQDKVIEPWCKGLVDPNWVLRIPKNKCGKMGYGPNLEGEDVIGETIGMCEGLAKSCINDIGCGANGKCKLTLPEKIVSRADDYCADEQSCIKESATGSCDKFGYCTREKRLWAFDKNTNQSCEAINNTCQSFVDYNGKNVSYLKNTLDYATCSSAVAGCAEYSTEELANTPYNIKDNLISWKETGPFKYYDKDALACDPINEGCAELIRLREGGQVNLIANSGFEYCQKNNDDTWKCPEPNPYMVSGNTIVESGDSSNKSLFVKGTSNNFYGSYDSSETGQTSLLPAGFLIQKDQVYIISAKVKSSEVGQTISLELKNSGNIIKQKDIITTNNEAWNYVELMIHNNNNINFDNFKIVSKKDFYLDNVKFEIVQPGTTQASSYSDYAQAPKIYEKILPKYLETTCYKLGNANDRYELRTGAPDICKKFARQCNQEEAGCEMFTGVDEDIQVPGQVGDGDYCSSECLGYDSFAQKEDSLNVAGLAYFIPKTGKACSAENVGCSKFLNLSDLANGGEQATYFSQVKHCIKVNDDKCGNFYTWQGGESGQQIKNLLLEKDGAAPMVLAGGTCTEDQANPNSANYNDDCLEINYKAASGAVTKGYFLYSKTITCSNECRDYKKIDTTNEVDCETKGGDWQGSTGCIFSTMINESKTCSESENGCREYTGNQGNNIRTIFSSNFNSKTTTDEWLTTGASQISADSLVASSNSYIINGNARKLVNNLLDNKTYVLSFLAKKSTSGAGITKIGFGRSDDFTINTSDIITGANQLSNDWQLYKFNLKSLTSVKNVKSLVISGNFLIDNIKLKEVQDNYYLIKNSWKTPEACDKDIDGNLHPLYMLGCSQYTDRDNNPYNLRSFNKLCQESGVGCSMMIKTNNSTAVYDYKEDNTTTESKDEVIYVVYDKTKLCDQKEKGCTRLGKAYVFPDTTLYKDTYLKIDLDKVNPVSDSGNIACTQAEVGCQAYGDSNFKEPGNLVCEWRAGREGDNKGKMNWFKKPLKKCGGVSAGKYCLTDKECQTATNTTIACLEDITEVLCPLDTAKPKTIGRGDSLVEQPGLDATGNHWVGLCEAKNSSCTEYIDPLAKFNANLIRNNNLNIIGKVYSGTESSCSGTETGCVNKYDGWVSSTNELTQRLALKKNTLYTLNASGFASEIIGDGENDYNFQITCESNALQPIFILNLENEFNSGLFYKNLKDKDNKIIFYLHDRVNVNYIPQCTLTLHNFATNQNIKLSLKEAVVDYRFPQDPNITPRPSKVDFEKGYVLFNERAKSSNKYANLTYNTNLTDPDDNGKDPKPATAGVLGNDTNVLLAVRPTRTCDQWLACQEYIDSETEGGEPTCTRLGLCKKMGTDGNCDPQTGWDTTVVKKNVALYNGESSTGFNVADFANLTGYSLVSFDEKYPNAVYNLSKMAEYGTGSDQAFIASFEDNTPEQFTTSTSSKFCFDENQADNCIMNNPAFVQNRTKVGDKKGYAPDGKNIFVASVSGSKTANPLVFRQGMQYIISAEVFKGGTIGLVDLTQQIFPTPTTSTPYTTSHTNDKLLGAAYSSGWNKVILKFKPSVNVEGKLEIKNGYFDDIRIEAALNYNENKKVVGTETVTTYNYLAKSCRLYPKQNSLSCEYAEKSGTRQKGWTGYCLQWDPLNPRACLMWYPIGRVRGDIDENLTPPVKATDNLYYCAKKLKEERFVYRDGGWISKGGHCGSCGAIDCPENWDSDCDLSSTWCGMFSRWRNRSCSRVPGWVEVGNTRPGLVEYTDDYVNRGGKRNIKDITICGVDNNGVARECTIPGDIYIRTFDRDASDKIIFYSKSGGDIVIENSHIATQKIEDIPDSTFGTDRYACGDIYATIGEKIWFDRMKSDVHGLPRCYKLINGTSTDTCPYSATTSPYGTIGTTVGVIIGGVDSSNALNLKIKDTLGNFEYLHDGNEEVVKKDLKTIFANDSLYSTIAQGKCKPLYPGETTGYINCDLSKPCLVTSVTKFCDYNGDKIQDTDETQCESAPCTNTCSESALTCGNNASCTITNPPATKCDDITINGSCGFSGLYEQVCVSIDYDGETCLDQNGCVTCSNDYDKPINQCNTSKTSTAKFNGKVCKTDANCSCQTSFSCSKSNQQCNAIKNETTGVVEKDDTLCNNRCFVKTNVPDTPSICMDNKYRLNKQNNGTLSNEGFSLINISMNEECSEGEIIDLERSRDYKKSANGSLVACTTLNQATVCTGGYGLCDGYCYKDRTREYNTVTCTTANATAKCTTASTFDKCDTILGLCYKNTDYDEYCFFNPIIEDVTVGPKGGQVYDNQETIEIKTGGDYTLKFYTNVDKEQLPLKEIKIDWGDNTIQTVPLSSNDNILRSFTHSYVYVSPTSSNNNGGLVQCNYGNNNCTGTKIKIMIKDNWGKYNKDSMGDYGDFYGPTIKLKP